MDLIEQVHHRIMNTPISIQLNFKIPMSKSTPTKPSKTDSLHTNESPSTNPESVVTLLTPATNQLNLTPSTPEN